MAAEFLAFHGIDLQAEMDAAQDASLPPQTSAPTDPRSPANPNTKDPSEPSHPLDLDLPPPTRLTSLHNILVPPSPHPQTLSISPAGHILSIHPSPSQAPSPAPPLLALPSLCHPHMHLDKPHLLSHRQTAHLVPQTGSFAEALALTAQAKKHYTRASLLERGSQLLADSVAAGVTHMRAFVEVDSTVRLLCLAAGLELKRAWKDHVEVQICAFAQDPIFTTLNNDDDDDDDEEGGRKGKVKGYVEEGNENLALLQQALDMEGVEALGTTPYVEGSAEAGRRNVEWAAREARRRRVHLDFHLDYNLDAAREPMVWDVLEALKGAGWGGREDVSRAVADDANKRHAGPTGERNGNGNGSRRTVCLAHCTRLTLFSAAEWARLAATVESNHLPVYFVGLPTSDLFMQGRPPPSTASTAPALASNRPRCTLPLPALSSALGLRCALGANNVGNAFTPFGTADPLALACWGVGLYQVATRAGVRGLFAMVSWRAREAIGLCGGEDEGAEATRGFPQEAGGRGDGNEEESLLRVGQRADLLLFGDAAGSGAFGGGDDDDGDGVERGSGSGAAPRRRRFRRARRSVEEVVWDPGVERTVVFGGKVVRVD